MSLTGMDVGNGNVKTAYVDATGKPLAVQDSRGERAMPACIYIDEATGQTLYGRDAIEQGYVDPANFVSRIKPRIGSAEPLLAGKTAGELTTMLVSEVNLLTERQTGESVDAVVLTVPARFDDHEKKSMRLAVEAAGVEVIRVISEPAAAAFAYAANLPSGEIMVFDLGSSTLDVTACSLGGKAVDVLATAGVRDLGGDGFDTAIQTLVLDELEQKTGVARAQALADPLFVFDLAVRVTQAKISLNTRDEVRIPLAFGGRHEAVVVTKAAFEAAIAPQIDQALAAIDEVVQVAGLKLEAISSVYMVGGPCRSPYVQMRVAEHTGCVPRAEIDPETAVAQGAALVAHSEQRRAGRKSTFGAEVIPQPSAFLREVIHHDIGVAIEDRSSGTRRLVNSVIVPKNTPIPSQRVDKFRLESADQREVLIEVLQGPDRVDWDDCTVIGRLELSDLPPEAARTPRIEVTFDFDSNTFVTVNARDLVSGKQVSTTVEVQA